jgi:hypothetical protein
VLRRRPRWWGLGTAAVLLVLGGLAGAFWLLHQVGRTQESVRLLRADGSRLQQQVQGGDISGAAATLRSLRLHADQARSQTAGPVWGTAALVPVLGRDLSAVRTVTASVAGIADAAAPLETTLPVLAPGGKPFAGGQVDIQALRSTADSLPGLSAAVASSDQAVQGISTSGLRPEVADGVVTLQRLLTAVRGPLADAVPSLQLLSPMLGADRPKTWIVLLQQGAEARGTGGLVGAYAVLHTDKGRIQLVETAPRSHLQTAVGIPSTSVPEDVQDLWGTDLNEWAGLNLSPNFPWTGKLVADGWKAQGRAPQLDYVLGIDQGVVSALLAGTGPVDVRGQKVDAGSAVPFLTRDVYARYRNPQDVDKVTAELVSQVFTRFATGQVNLAELIRAAAPQVHQRRLQLWSADQAQQRLLEGMSVGGVIPDDPGPFAMAVVNNGGGNKLDAYLTVHTAYDPGTCAQQVRVGHITVDLTNGAPSVGLPGYVDVRSDVNAIGLKALGLTARPKPGSNRLILDVYGPVGGEAALVTLDGVATPVTAGSDRGHSVWRVIVPIDPGQKRVVDVVVSQPVGFGLGTDHPTVMVQPMVNPATSTVGAMSPCRNNPGNSG